MKKLHLKLKIMNLMTKSLTSNPNIRNIRTVSTIPNKNFLNLKPISIYLKRLKRKKNPKTPNQRKRNFPMI